MDNNLHQRDLRELRQSNRRKDLINGATVLALLLSLYVNVRTLGMERTVVVPPNIEKTFWVTAETGDKAYLNQMAAFVAWLILDVDPSTVDWKKDVLLDFMAPEDHGAMKTKLELAAHKLKAMNASTSFLPQQLVVDDKRLSVTLHGRLRRQVNGEETGKETKSYLAQFGFSGGRVHLQAFKEIQDAHIDAQGNALPTASTGQLAAAQSGINGSATDPVTDDAEERAGQATAAADRSQ